MCFSPSSITDWVACWSTGCWAIPVWQESPSIGGLAKEILEGESCGYHVTHHVKLRQICACVVRLKWLLMPMLWTLWYTCDCHVILLYIVCYGSACCGAPSFFLFVAVWFCSSLHEKERDCSWRNNAKPHRPAICTHPSSGKLTCKVQSTKSGVQSLIYPVSPVDQ